VDNIMVVSTDHMTVPVTYDVIMMVNVVSGCVMAAVVVMVLGQRGLRRKRQHGCQHQGKVGCRHGTFL